MLKPETTNYAKTAGVESDSDARPLSSSKLQRFIKLILLDPYRSSTPDGIALLVFGLKLVLILPFVNVPSVLRIHHQLDLAWNPLAAEALSADCTSAGHFELKGIDTPIELFSIRKPS